MKLYCVVPFKQMQSGEMLYVAVWESRNCVMDSHFFTSGWNQSETGVLQQAWTVLRRELWKEKRNARLCNQRKDFHKMWLSSANLRIKEFLKEMKRNPNLRNKLYSFPTLSRKMEGQLALERL